MTGRARYRGRSRFKRIAYGTAWRKEQRANWRRLRILVGVGAAVTILVLVLVVVLSPT